MSGHALFIIIFVWDKNQNYSHTYKNVHINPKIYFSLFYPYSYLSLFNLLFNKFCLIYFFVHKEINKFVLLVNHKLNRFTR
jgi:hypothetical protein